MEKIQYNRFLLVKENFYLNPSIVLDVALNIMNPNMSQALEANLSIMKKG
jgi:hypothetical protein